MLHRTEGIVLKTSPFGEADLIVTYLTNDFGIIRTFAKSPRKIKSRFGSSLEPLTCSRISFWGKEDASLPRLTQSDIIAPFASIRGRLHDFLKASEIIELTLNFVPERDASKGIYSLLLNTLQAMEQECKNNLVMIYYKLKLLQMSGYLPGLDNCGRCGKEGNVFYLSHGTILCDACSRGIESSLRVSPGAIHFSSHLLNWDASKINRIKPSDMLVAELAALIDDHVRYITERDLKTKAFRIS